MLRARQTRHEELERTALPAWKVEMKYGVFVTRILAEYNSVMQVLKS